MARLPHVRPTALAAGFADARVGSVDWYLGGGVTYTCPIAGRDEDQLVNC